MRRASCGDALLGPGRQVPRRPGADAVLLLVLAVPLHLAGRDARHHLGQRAEVELPERKRREPLVAEHADVDLAALDVLLDQRVGAGLLVDELDALAQLLAVVDDRGLRDAERRVLGRRLHEQREREAPRLAVAPVARQQREARGRDAVVGQDLLRQHLVARDHHAARIAARVGQLHQLEERHHVLVVGDDALEFLEQVERDVRLPVGDRVAQVRQVVAHAEHLHFVAHRAQRRRDVVLGPPVVDLLLGVAARVLRRHQGLVHQHQHAPLLHSA